MANGWTLERKQRHAELIRSWKPWEKSTGPKTAEGKASASQNAFRGNQRQREREVLKALRESMREQLHFINDISQGL